MFRTNFEELQKSKEAEEPVAEAEEPVAQEAESEEPVAQEAESEERPRKRNRVGRLNLNL